MENRLHGLIPEAWYPRALQQSPDWLWFVDQDGEEPLGVAPADNAGARLSGRVYAADLPELEDACVELVRDGRAFTLDFRVVLRSGRLLWLEGKGYPLEDGHAVIAARDITAFKQQEERLSRLAYYDALTGLPNRRLFQDRFMQALYMAKRYHHKLAVLYLDMDDFKQVNDSFGHAAGDELLILAASRLSHSIREPDTVCRLGGDEFVLLLQQFEIKEDILKIGRRIGDALSQPFDIGGRGIRISSSIGASFYPDDGKDLDTLLKCADAAMYASKQRGKNRLELFSEP
ncbi:diguanylate cyclase domain-containing protein [Paenibacillus mucilaginosus 3016]|uniref:Diguanylate cyclase domain-containing protein n=1 Tax=Paenibacillus mucilaginosus 3016 TaxID=1116391 RepID=H6NR58_9BACL|nr:sensor domain-containing diguanylate cyclase [Paenibacillus mucilaginosus]AFC32751.1 diguanylate cyclase domain-containing protein [Paenibacillus mucilaginosus 3016]WFA21216.1 sensor domain-containing diguanylate cyclase [Paenibacillus mucilaginosus]